MRRAIVAGGALALALGLGVVAATTGVLPGLQAAASASPSAAPDAAPVKTAEVVKRTMEASSDLDGTLGYDGEGAIGAGAPGTLTRLPEPGTVIERGQPLYELDGRLRPRLLYGDRPAWRPLHPGVSDGADVEQLERNLVALGRAPKGLHVDRHWTDRTTTAVKRWQRATGRHADGTLDGSDLVFLPGAVRVASQDASVGDAVAPGTPVLSTTSATRVVTVDLTASHQALLAPGTAVSIELPDESTIAGTVREVGRVATAAQDGTLMVPVVIDIDAGATLPELDAAPVTVHVVTDRRDDVLAVPVNALVALLEGGYAVEVVGDDGSHRYVRVETGLFEDGAVEVRGDGLGAGYRVVVAR